MTEEFRARSEPDDVDLPEGVALDPMCGMRVRLGPSAITLEHDGETKAFCAAACRAAYARQHGLPVPA
jgi:YHS domain-containing protein